MRSFNTVFMFIIFSLSLVLISTSYAYGAPKCSSCEQQACLSQCSKLPADELYEWIKTSDGLYLLKLWVLPGDQIYIESTHETEMRTRAGIWKDDCGGAPRAILKNYHSNRYCGPWRFRNPGQTACVVCVIPEWYKYQENSKNAVKRLPFKKNHAKISSLGYEDLIASFECDGDNDFDDLVLKVHWSSERRAHHNRPVKKPRQRIATPPEPLPFDRVVPQGDENIETETDQHPEVKSDK